MRTVPTLMSWGLMSWGRILSSISLIVVFSISVSIAGMSVLGQEHAGPLNDADFGLASENSSPYYRASARVVRVNDKAGALLITPYIWHAELKNKQLSLGGYVPSDEIRDALMAEARKAFASYPIVDKMAVGTGAPRDWLATAIVILEQLSLLKEGKASLKDKTLTLAGLAQRQETADQIRSALRTRLTAVYDVQHDIKHQQAAISTARPFKSIIEFRNGHFRLSGYAPVAAAQDRLIAMIRSERPDAVISNGMLIAKGASEDWFSCALAGLSGLLKLDQGILEVVDSTLTLRGVTRQEEIGEALPKQLRAAANRTCQETLDLRVEIPPEPSLEWYARYENKNENKSLLIAGEVPDSGVQNNLTELASQLFPDTKLSVDLRVNPNRTKKWPQVAEIALKALAKLRRGEARIVAQTLTLAGEAKDTAVETAIGQQIKSGIPKGYKARSNIQVKSAAMLWAEQQAARSEAKAASQPERHDDKASEKKQESSNTSQPAVAEKLAFQPPSGAVPEVGDVTSISRDVSGKTSQQKMQRAADAGQKSQITPQQKWQIESEKCQQVLNATMRADRITFAVGSDQITPENHALLGRLLSLPKVCEGHIIEISSHTDSKGSKASNQLLSERRAKSVRSYLIGIGMPADRLQTRGYGETQPLFPNTTLENRARNRRIEFNVRVQ